MLHLAGCLLDVAAEHRLAVFAQVAARLMQRLRRLLQPAAHPVELAVRLLLCRFRRLRDRFACRVGRLLDGLAGLPGRPAAACAALRCGGRGRAADSLVHHLRLLLAE